MIYFLHNTFNRPNQVIKHSTIEKTYYPDSKHIIVYNNSLNFENNSTIDFFYFGENRGHKAGCLNAVYSALKYLIEKYNPEDTDIIFFSHDDIYLSNNEKVSKYVNMMNEYDFIGRRCIKNKHVPDNCNHYVMMESFFIKPVIAKLLIENYMYNEITDNYLMRDKLNSISPEMNFGRDIFKKYFGKTIYIFT